MHKQKIYKFLGKVQNQKLRIMEFPSSIFHLRGDGNVWPGVPPPTDGPEDPGPLDGDGGDGPYAPHPGHRPHHPVHLHQADI